MRPSTIAWVAALVVTNLAWWTLSAQPATESPDAAANRDLVPEQAALRDALDAATRESTARAGALRDAQRRLRELEAADAERQLASAAAQKAQAEAERNTAATATAETEERAAAVKALQESARQSKAWVEAVTQIDDPSRRAAALAEIRAALAGDDALLARAALAALPQILAVEFPREGLRELIVPHVAHDDPWARRSAWYALNVLGPQPGDLERLLDLADDGPQAFGNSLSHLIVTYAERKPRGAASTALSRLLETDDRRTQRENLRGLWGADLEPEVQDRLVAIASAEGGESRHDAIYFGLSTLVPKTPAVVDALLAAAADPDANVWQRALWGLRQGVDAETAPRVVEGLAKLLRARASPQVQGDIVQTLASLPTNDRVAVLRDIAADDRLPETTRDRAAALLQR